MARIAASSMAAAAANDSLLMRLFLWVSLESSLTGQSVIPRALKGNVSSLEDCCTCPRQVSTL